MKDEFYVVLPSDSSMSYYPDNTVARFITQLPEEIKLQGKWVVGLTEFSFPTSFSNVKNGTFFDATLHTDSGDNEKIDRNVIAKGYYNNPSHIISALNDNAGNDIFEFKLNNKGYISFTFNPGEYKSVMIQQTDQLKSILGFHENLL